MYFTQKFTSQHACFAVVGHAYIIPVLNAWLAPYKFTINSMTKVAVMYFKYSLCSVVILLNCEKLVD
jgi:hypothetical protein